MFKTCISQLFFFPLFSLTKTSGRAGTMGSAGSSGKGAEGAVGGEPSDAPEGLEEPGKGWGWGRVRGLPQGRALSSDSHVLNVPKLSPPCYGNLVFLPVRE